jgi:hypothetical protein
LPGLCRIPGIPVKTRATGYSGWLAVRLHRLLVQLLSVRYRLTAGPLIILLLGRRLLDRLLLLISSILRRLLKGSAGAGKRLIGRLSCGRLRGPLPTRLSSTLVGWLSGLCRGSVGRLIYRPAVPLVDGRIDGLSIRSAIRLTCTLAAWLGSTLISGGRGTLVASLAGWRIATIVATVVVPVIVITIVTVIPVTIIHRCIDGACVVKRLDAGGGKAGATAAVVGRRGGIDPGAIDGQASIIVLFAGSAGLPDRYRSYRSAGESAYIVGVGTAGIVVPAAVITAAAPEIIIDHRRIINDADVPRLIHIIITDLRAADILMRYKAPVMRRRVVAASERDVHADIGSKGRPTIIIGTIPPAYPGRRPFLAGDPHPSITILEEPAAIVEGGPSPWIIGSPGPAFISIYPMAIGGIRFEIRASVRQPDVPVLRIIHPLTIRTQLVVERLVRQIFRFGDWLSRSRGSGVLMNHVDGSTGIKGKGHDGQEQ